MGWDLHNQIHHRFSQFDKGKHFHNKKEIDFLIISQKIDHLLDQDTIPQYSTMKETSFVHDGKQDEKTENNDQNDTFIFSASSSSTQKDFVKKNKDNESVFKNKINKNSISLKNDNLFHNEKTKMIDFKISTFGWKDLGRAQIVFDEQQNEYIYSVEEPLLNEDEITLKDKLIHLFQINTDIDVSLFSEKVKKEHLVNILEDIIDLHKIKISEQKKDKIFYYIFQEFLGYGKIDILMKDPEIEDISCDGTNVPLFVFHRKYESIKTNIVYTDDEELDSFVFKITQICGKQLSIYEPIVDGRLPEGDRLQATLGKTITKGSTFTIRRFNENPLTPIDLIDNGTMTAEMAAYFWFLMDHGVSILFCGGTASGKTTLLNALSLFIPSSSKIVSAEDTREINLPHENWIAGTTRQGFISSDEAKSRHEIDMFDLVKAALRQRPRIIIVGEVRGREANTMFQAMATGHLSYSTMHASDMQSLVQRLENKPISLPRSLMVSLDIVVFVKTINTSDGGIARRVDDVIEIMKLDPESNRLITVNPFSWVSPAHDVIENNENSYIINNIKKLRGWGNKRLSDELEHRKAMLEWMLNNDIRSYREVGKIISNYGKNPKSFLKKIDPVVA